MAVEALYTGNVKINRRSLMSLSSVERCVRTFQQIGLLENYSIQISSLLPLENFNSTRTHTVRPVSPPSPQAQSTLRSLSVSPSPEMTRVNPPIIADNNEENEDGGNPSQFTEETHFSAELDSASSEVTNYTHADNENNVSEPEPTPKAQSPKRKSLSPNKQDNVRKDCNKPRFSEVSLEEIKDMESSDPGDVICWLQDIGFLCSAPPRCRGCGKLTQLQESPDIDGLAWKCPSREKCVPGQVSPSLLREHSIFQFSKDKLLWILKIIICWRENTSLSQCHEETEASIDQIFFWYEKCRQFFGPIADDEG